jgi:hypothetical protein
MNKQTNIEDNIFILNIRIRMIRDLLILDAEPSLFLEKTLDDMDFINANLGLLLGILMKNERLMERDDLFHSLYETEQRFLDVLAEMEYGQGTISGTRFPEIREKITLLRNNTMSRQKTVEGSIHKGDPLSINPMMVSSDELSELLKDIP